MTRIESRSTPAPDPGKPLRTGGQQAPADAGVPARTVPGRAADVVERFTRSAFGTPATPAAAGSRAPMPELLRKADALVDLAGLASRSLGEDGGRSKGLAFVETAVSVRDALGQIAGGLARGSSLEEAGLLGKELAELDRGLDAGSDALRKLVDAPTPAEAGKAHGLLQSLLGLAGRVARRLFPGGGLLTALLSRARAASGAEAKSAEAPPTADAGSKVLRGFDERTLKEGMGDFLGDSERAANRSWDRGRQVETRKTADGSTRGSFENGASVYEETGVTLGDPGFSVDGEYLKPSAGSREASAVDKAVGAVLDGIGELHAEGSFHHEASVVHEQGQVYVGNENAHFAARGEISVLEASVSGSGSVDVSGGRLTARGHLEAQATLVDASGQIDARLGPASLQASGSAYVGAKATVDGAVSIDPAHGVYAAKIQAKAFAGATAEATARGSIGDVASGEIGVGAWAGVGARFNLDAGFKDGEFKFKLDLGAAIGVGFNINIGFSVNFKKIGEKISGFFKDLGSAFGGGGGAGPSLIGQGGVPVVDWARALSEAFEKSRSE